MQTEHSKAPPQTPQPPLPAASNDNDGAAVNGAVAPGVAMNSAPSQTAPAHAAAKREAAPETSALGSWFARNRWFTHRPISYLGFQFFRASIATIPYGFMMALGHHVFNLFSVWGQKAGLTAKGIEEFGKQGGVLGLEKLANTSKTVEAELYQAGTKGVLGRGLMRLGNSPMNAAVQIGLGFTLFRFTGGVVKNLRDRIINNRNTEQETIHETKNWWQTVRETIHINWVAELTATPIAAIVLGFMNAAYNAPDKAFMPFRDKSQSFVQNVKRVWGPKSKLFQNSMVWTLSYSLFFLLAECLFKDKQIQRGQWKGHPNSLKNGPDDTVGGPGAVHYLSPDEEEYVKPGKKKISNDLADDGLLKRVELTQDKKEKKKDDNVAQDTNDKLRYPFFTGEPSWGRFIFRRVLPVCLGISAYAALKRVGYLMEVPGVKLSGPMAGIDVAKYDAMKVEGDALKTVANHGKLYLQNAWREGKATIMFGALWASTDFFGDVYDKFFHKLQQKEHQVPLNDNQQKHHAELLARLNEKYQGQGRAA